MSRTAIAAEVTIALILFGCIPVVVKSIDANPWTIGIVRLGVASAGLLLVLQLPGLRGREKRTLRPRDYLRLAIIGAFFFAHWATYFIAIKRSSASIGAIGLSTYGIHLLILGAIAGHHRLRAADVLAVLVAVAGALLIVPELTLANETTAGLLLASFSALMYAVLPLLHQRWSDLSSFTRALGQFWFALAFFLLFLPQARWELAGRDWAGLMFLAVGSTLIGHTLWVRVTTHLAPAATSVLYYLNLPFAIVLSAVILHEPLLGRTLAGAFLILAGSGFGLLVQWRRSRRPGLQSPPE